MVHHVPLYCCIFLWRSQPDQFLCSSDRSQPVQLRRLNLTFFPNNTWKTYNDKCCHTRNWWLNKGESSPFVVLRMCSNVWCDVRAPCFLFTRKWGRQSANVVLLVPPWKTNGSPLNCHEGWKAIRWYCPFETVPFQGTCWFSIRSIVCSNGFLITFVWKGTVVIIQWF